MSNRTQYWCHNCSKITLASHNLQCQFCHSSAIEEIEGPQHPAHFVPHVIEQQTHSLPSQNLRRTFQEMRSTRRESRRRLFEQQQSFDERSNQSNQNIRRAGQEIRNRDRLRRHQQRQQRIRQMFNLHHIHEQHNQQSLFDLQRISGQQSDPQYDLILQFFQDQSSSFSQLPQPSQQSFFRPLILNRLGNFTMTFVFDFPQQQEKKNVSEQKWNSLQKIDKLTQECSVCQETQGSGIRLACGHQFHEHCLRPWLMEKDTCPNCRANV